MVTVPGGTHITVNTNAIHTLPEYWGADALEWRPSRWIQTDDEGTEKVLTPEKGLFYGWSDGMRACPGKKFGHLEHMALMASIIRDHVVEPAAENGESFEETRQRIMGVVKDSGMVLNVQMFHPEKASLVWRRC
jgi:cytochrome P450